MLAFYPPDREQYGDTCRDGQLPGVNRLPSQRLSATGAVRKNAPTHIAKTPS